MKGRVRQNYKEEEEQSVRKREGNDQSAGRRRKWKRGK
jgi:hypothetical protein